MLSIFICEDDKYQRKAMESIVKNWIAKKNYKDVELLLSTDNPKTLLQDLESHPIRQALYILDVDLQHEMDGIVLASEIRKMDVWGKIIFVTTYEELSHLTFQYKVEAMDYILKDAPDGIEKKVEECIELTYAHFSNDKQASRRGYQVKIGNRIRVIPYDDIIFFESSTHSHRKIILHMENSWLEYYGSLNEAENIGAEFFRCHQSFVLNMNNVTSVIKDKRIAKMRGGRQAFIAIRKMRELLRRIDLRTIDHENSNAT